MGYLADPPDGPTIACRYDSSLGKHHLYCIFSFHVSIHLGLISMINLQLAIVILDKECTMFLAGLLTKKFISLIQEATDGILDLNKTADLLAVRFPYFLNILTFFL